MDNMKKFKLVVYFTDDFDVGPKVEYDIDAYGDAIPGVFYWEEDGAVTYMPWRNIDWLMVKENK